MLPQNRGFFTVKANEDLPTGDGGGTAAPALPLAARSAAGSGSDSGGNLQHRSRRSTGESTMPKVYGQVMYCISFGTGHMHANTVHHPRLPLAGKDVLEDIMQAPGCFLSHLISYTLTPTCAWQCVYVCIGEGVKVTLLTSKPHREGTEQSTVGLPGVFDASVNTAPQT